MTILLFAPLPSYADRFLFATWNVRILSDGSRSDEELHMIADVIRRYDFVAIQEARDTRVLDRLLELLPGYDYVASRPVGRGVREVYAFLFRESLVEVLGEPYLFPDPQDLFIREPYVAHFRVGAFDFTMASVHVLYGDSITDRRTEVRLLDDVLRAIDYANGEESDVLLVGDFNVPADDPSWEMATWDYLVEPHMKTTITDTSSFDNVFYQAQLTRELQSLVEIFAFDEVMFGNNDDAASLAVSDHRPVAAWIELPDSDDDAEGLWTRVPPGLSMTNDNDIRRTGRIQFSRVVAHPTNEEAVTIENMDAFAIDMTGWIMGDKNDPNAYRVPRGTILQPTERLLFRASRMGFQINNGSEELFLWDASGELVDSWRN